MNTARIRLSYPDAFAAGKLAAIEHYRAVDAGERAEHPLPENPHGDGSTAARWSQQDEPTPFLAWRCGWHAGLDLVIEREDKP